MRARAKYGGPASGGSVHVAPHAVNRLLTHHIHAHNEIRQQIASTDAHANGRLGVHSVDALSQELQGSYSVAWRWVSAMFPSLAE